jgi:LysM repeat protein
MITKSQHNYLPGRAARLISALLLLAVLFSALPAMNAQAAATPTCAYNHKVRNGQTLEKIASLYGVTVKQLKDANDIDSNNDLEVGMILCIPAKSNAAKPTFTASASNGKVRLSGSNFAKGQSMIVRVFGGRFNTSSAKIGRVKADADGKIAGTFTLTDRLRDETILRVCLKDQRTDALLCQSITNR